jgi:hypothetical protein
MIAIPNKTVLVSARVTPGRMASYREAAASEGMRLSEWIRRQLDRRVAELQRKASQ